MGFGSLWHWIIVLLVVLVLFGRGRVSEIMGDFGKGIKSFKQGLNDEDNKPAAPPPPQIPAQTSTPSQTQSSSQPQATLNGDTVVDPNKPGR
jgi:sec-independent protein translocase protein TatA